MKIYNTLTKKKEEFKPIDGNTARIYSCGPTVYSYAHIGNLRTYIFMDCLRRVLRLNGFSIYHVMNITDVGHLVADSDDGEDKMEKAAKAQNKSPWEIAQFYTEIFFKDLNALNIEIPEMTPKVTDHISEMIDFVKALIEKGYGYETSDGIYFDIQKFPGYGKLSNLNLDEQIAGARVDVNEEKHHPADFALWKKAPKEHIMQWKSPWGMGYPGWHIECSALCLKYLGEVFDIHTGGVDHIPVHHENEIAQSEALIGKPTVKFWMHGEFLLVNNGKMSKSLGNTYTIADLEYKGFSPLAYRYFCLNGHYRNKLNFTWEAIKAAQVSLDRLYEGVIKHKDAKDQIDAEVLSKWEDEFNETVSDDLNLPLALSVVWNAVKYSKKSNEIYEFLIKTDKILGLGLDKAVSKDNSYSDEQLEPELMELIAKRVEAKKNKDFAASDDIRNQLKEKGITIVDTKDGVRWERC